VSVLRLLPFKRLSRAEPFSFPLIRFRKPRQFDDIESFAKRSGWRTTGLARVDLGLLANGLLIGEHSGWTSGYSSQQVGLLREADWEYEVCSMGA
jgi:hypothetical protein